MADYVFKVEVSFTELDSPVFFHRQPIDNLDRCFDILRNKLVGLYDILNEIGFKLHWYHEDDKIIISNEEDLRTFIELNGKRVVVSRASHGLSIDGEKQSGATRNESHLESLLNETKNCTDVPELPSGNQASIELENNLYNEHKLHELRMKFNSKEATVDHLIDINNSSSDDDIGCVEANRSKHTEGIPKTVGYQNTKSNVEIKPKTTVGEVVDFEQHNREELASILTQKNSLIRNRVKNVQFQKSPTLCADVRCKIPLPVWIPKASAHIEQPISAVQTQTSIELPGLAKNAEIRSSSSANVILPSTSYITEHSEKMQKTVALRDSTQSNVRFDALIEPETNNGMAPLLEASLSLLNISPSIPDTSDRSDVSPNLHVKSDSTKYTEAVRKFFAERGKTGLINISDISDTSDISDRSDVSTKYTEAIRKFAAQPVRIGHTSLRNISPSISIQDTSDRSDVSPNVHVKSDSRKYTEAIRKCVSQPVKIGHTAEPVANSNYFERPATQTTMLAQIIHSNQQINESIIQMLSLGFSNGGGWLTCLMESVNGDVAEAISTLNPDKKIQKD